MQEEYSKYLMYDIYIGSIIPNLPCLSQTAEEYIQTRAGGFLTFKVYLH